MQNSIKICYLIPEYNEETDSHFYHHYEFLEKLSNHFDIFLIAEKGVPMKDLNLGVKRFYIQKFKFVPLRFLESFLIILRARMLGYKNFYTHYCYIGAINAGIISRLSGGKSYYWNCAMNWLFKQKTLPWFSYKLSLKLSHYLVTGSEKMKEGYAEHYGLKLEKIKVVPNWINLERFNRGYTQIVSEQSSEHADTRGKSASISVLPKAQDQRVSAKLPKVILFVHWLSKRKGADTIIPILKELASNPKPEIRNPKLIVVGEGPYKEQLEKEIKENKLGKYIEVLGAIPNKNLPEYYAKADILIMPSMEEGFPRVLLEAMATGLPYVASDVGAVREISPETAQRFLVKPGEVEKFAQKIEILLTDEKIYNQFKKEELEKVKEYSLDRVVDKFIKVIDK